MTDEMLPEGMIRAVDVVACTKQSLSTDGTKVALVFDLAGGDEIMMTFPVTSLAMMQTLMRDLRTLVEKRMQTTMGNVPFRTPKVYTVGHSDDVRGHVAIILDPETPQEAVFMFQDRDALNIVAAIQKDIAGRNSPADVKARQQQAGISPSGKIIIPGRGH